MLHHKGGILCITMLIMFVGMVILSGLFTYLDVSLKLASHAEAQAVRFYAVDSGIESGISWLQHKPWLNSTIPLGEWEACDILKTPCNTSYRLNNCDVGVRVTCDTFSENTSGVYKIHSSTVGMAIEAYVSMNHTANFTVNATNAVNVSYSAQILTYKILK